MVVIDNNLQLETCPVCRSNRIKKHRSDVHYQKPIFFSSIEIDLINKSAVWACEECNSKFLQNAIPESEAIKLYTSGDSEKRWTVKSFKEEKTEDVLNILNGYLKSNIKLFDIGCSTGNLLDYAQSQGCSTYGVEYSTNAVATARKKGHIIYTDMGHVKEQFDVITAFDVVEHLYDLPQFFQTTHDLLNPNGHLILLTGNPDSKTARLVKNNWWYFKLPEHIVFPSFFFFKNKLQFFDLKLYHETYNSKIYITRNKAKLLKTTIHFLIKNRRYIGLPSIGPDHALIVLKRITTN